MTGKVIFKVIAAGIALWAIANIVGSCQSNKTNGPSWKEAHWHWRDCNENGPVNNGARRAIILVNDGHSFIAELEFARQDGSLDSSRIVADIRSGTGSWSQNRENSGNGLSGGRIKGFQSTGKMFIFWYEGIPGRYCQIFSGPTPKF